MSLGRKQENTNEKDMGSCNRSEGRICVKEEKVYPLLREEKEEVCKFINKQLRKGYIRLSKSLQITAVFFVEKKNNKN